MIHKSKLSFLKRFEETLLIDFELYLKIFSKIYFTRNTLFSYFSDTTKMKSYHQTLELFILAKKINHFQQMSALARNVLF